MSKQPKAPAPSSYRVRLRRFHESAKSREWVECWLIELPDSGSQGMLHGTLLPEDAERLAAWFANLGVEVAHDPDSPLPVAEESAGNPYRAGGLFDRIIPDTNQD